MKKIQSANFLSLMIFLYSVVVHLVFIVSLCFLIDGWLLFYVVFIEIEKRERERHFSFSFFCSLTYTRYIGRWSK